jgi:hypothetical protein
VSSVRSKVAVGEAESVGVLSISRKKPQNVYVVRHCQCSEELGLCSSYLSSPFGRVQYPDIQKMVRRIEGWRREVHF